MGVIISLQYFSLLILRLCTNFQVDLKPGMGRKVCGDVGWVVCGRPIQSFETHLLNVNFV